MPSLLLGNPLASGAQCVVSGGAGVYSGHMTPTSTLLLRWVSASGNCYIAFSGGGPPLSGNIMTIASGGFALSGGCLSGMLDGMPMAPGDTYLVPVVALTNKGPTSGLYNVFALADVAASGIGRLYFEFF